MNVLLHLSVQVNRCAIIDNMFQETIVEKVPVHVQSGPDLLKGYWWWNVGQILLDESLMQVAG